MCLELASVPQLMGINNEIFKVLGAVEMLLAALSGAMIKNQLLVLFFISLAVFQYGRQ